MVHLELSRKMQSLGTGGWVCLTFLEVHSSQQSMLLLISWGKWCVSKLRHGWEYPENTRETGGDYTIIKVKVNIKKRGWSRIKEMNMGYIKVKGDYLFYFVGCEHRNASHS